MTPQWQCCKPRKGLSDGRPRDFQRTNYYHTTGCRACRDCCAANRIVSATGRLWYTHRGSYANTTRNGCCTRSSGRGLCYRITLFDEHLRA